MSDHSDYTLKVTEEGIVEILSVYVRASWKMLHPY